MKWRKNYIIYALLKVNIHCDYFSLTCGATTKGERSENSHAKYQWGKCQGWQKDGRGEESVPKLLSLKKINYVYDNFHCTKIEAASRSRESNRRREREEGGNLGHGLPRMLSVKCGRWRGGVIVPCRLPSLPLLALMFS